MTPDAKAEKKALQAAEAAKAMAEYRAREAEIDRNTERLRALRLAKEAGEAAAPAKPASKSPARVLKKKGLAP
jgi:hypothetical protein